VGRPVVMAVGSGFGEERGDSGKLIDVKASPNGGWMRRSSTRWPWKRWWAALPLELYGDCSRGTGSGHGQVGMALRRTRAVLDAVHQR
jgi:hypothetical protein